MKTDIDRLHQFFAHPTAERGGGKTTAAIHKLCGEIQVGESPVIVCELAHYRDIHGWLTRMIMEIFREQGIDATVRRSPCCFAITTQFEGVTKKIMFVSRFDATGRLLGLGGNVARISLDDQDPVKWHQEYLGEFTKG